MKQNLEIAQIRKEIIKLQIKQTKLMARARYEDAVRREIFEDGTLTEGDNMKIVDRSINAYYKANNEANVIGRQIADLTKLLKQYQ